MLGYQRFRGLNHGHFQKSPKFNSMNINELYTSTRYSHYFPFLFTFSPQNNNGMNAETHLPAYRIRPRFKVETHLTPQEVINKIKAALQADDAVCEGNATIGFATLIIPEKDRHYWSPQLTVTVEATEGGIGSIVRGMYAPAPAVWTMFVFFYVGIGLAIIALTMVGLSYYSLDQPSTILWWVPVLAAVFLTLYLVSFFGQKLGRQQMGTLHGFVEGCLGMEIV